MLQDAVFNLQSVLSLPLQLDSSNTQALEKAMRMYNGKAMINSVNGKQSSMSEVFPLVQNTVALLFAFALMKAVFPKRRRAELILQRKSSKQPKAMV